MEIEELYKKVYRACVEFAVYRKKNIKENVADFLPALGQFANKFLEENHFGFDEEDYQQLRRLLLNILNDITQGLEQRDNVLLEDTVEFGLKEFLELFVMDEGELRRLKEESFSEQRDL